MPLELRGVFSKEDRSKASAPLWEAEAGGLPILGNLMKTCLKIKIQDWECSPWFNPQCHY